MKIRLKNLKDVKRQLKKLTKSEVPFVTSLAINNVTKEAQKDVRDHIHSEFTVRRKGYVNRAVKIVKWSHKTNLSSILAIDPPGSAKDVLSRHEWGGPQTPENSKHFAVPTETLWPNRKRVLAKRLRPENIKRTFKRKDATSGKLLLLRRKSKKIVQVAYVLTNKVRLQPRLKFVDTAKDTVNRRYEDIWEKTWSRTIAKKYGFRK